VCVYIGPIFSRLLHRWKEILFENEDGKESKVHVNGPEYDVLNAESQNLATFHSDGDALNSEDGEKEVT
jgi:hypothetical protein